MPSYTVDGLNFVTWIEIDVPVRSTVHLGKL